MAGLKSLPVAVTRSHLRPQAERELVCMNGSKSPEVRFGRFALDVFTHLCLNPVVVVVDYPTPSEGWGHGGRPWSPRSRATPQGLDQRS